MQKKHLAAMPPPANSLSRSRLSPRSSPRGQHLGEGPAPVQGDALPPAPEGLPAENALRGRRLSGNAPKETPQRGRRMVPSCCLRTRPKAGRMRFPAAQERSGGSGPALAKRSAGHSPSFRSASRAPVAWTGAWPCALWLASTFPASRRTPCMPCMRWKASPMPASARLRGRAANGNHPRPRARPRRGQPPSGLVPAKRVRGSKRWMGPRPRTPASRARRAPCPGEDSLRLRMRPAPRQSFRHR